MSKVARNLQRIRERGLKGFTLIELLIVIAIILILIAIALPNFLEAQERARVTRAKGNLRSMETALMAFRTQYGYFYADFNDPNQATHVSRNHRYPGFGPCPINGIGVAPDGGLDWSEMSTSDRVTFYSMGVHCPLTTPIKFIDASVTTDPWSDGSIPVGMDSRWVGDDSQNISAGMKYVAYFVSGPNRLQGEWRRGCETWGSQGIGCVYNPTNGTKSRGDLWMVLADDQAFAKNEYVPLRTF